ncbi:hypothetical protein [Nonomuraea sp. NPDC050540]|uniref:hypothetical protein n=1 Tax=Nonomuraea sp. NPDC050540 TaxID=3364367 RepID=UPI00379921F4
MAIRTATRSDLRDKDRIPHGRDIPFHHASRRRVPAFFGDLPTGGSPLAAKQISSTAAPTSYGVGRSTAYEALAGSQEDDQAARAKLETILAALPADNRPTPSTAAYDELLSRTPGTPA